MCYMRIYRAGYGVNFQLGELTIRPAGYGRLKKLDLQTHRVTDLSHLIPYHYALKLDFRE